MRSRSATWLISVALGAGGLWFCEVRGEAFPQKEALAARADVRVLTDRPVYLPESTAEVRFIVANTGSAPFYLSRDADECSSQSGSFSLELVDKEDHESNVSGCSADIDPHKFTSVLEEHPNPELWVLLKPGEIFGKVEMLELPKKRGMYRLKAELYPPAFLQDVKSVLTQRGIGVLQGPTPAPVVVLKVE